MKHDSITSTRRRPVNVSLDTGIVAAAREAGLNLSRITEDALRVAVKAERERRWQEEHRAAIEAHNQWIEQHGIPLSGLPAL